MSGAAVSALPIERSILIVRGHKVLLDAQLATLYDVEISDSAWFSISPADEILKPLRWQLSALRGEQP